MKETNTADSAKTKTQKDNIEADKESQREQERESIKERERETKKDVVEENNYLQNRFYAEEIFDSGAIHGRTTTRASTRVVVCTPHGGQVEGKFSPGSEGGIERTNAA